MELEPNLDYILGLNNINMNSTHLNQMHDLSIRIRASQILIHFSLKTLCINCFKDRSIRGFTVEISYVWDLSVRD